MTLALHGHHVLLIATLAFVTAVLTSNWYTRSTNDTTIDLNVFQICITSTQPKACEWTLSPQAKNFTSDKITLLYPILIASFAIVCVGISLIGLVLGSFYLEKFANENGAAWLLVCTFVAALFSFLFSCTVWAFMLTTNLQQKIFGTNNINIRDFGFSFWINIGSSGVYLYALVIYLIAICKS